MNIATERLIIRNFTSDDWRCVHEYTSDINVMKYIPGGVFSEGDSKEFVIKNSGEDAKHFPVLLKKDQTLIGHIAFHKYFGEHTYEKRRFFQEVYTSRKRMVG